MSTPLANVTEAIQRFAEPPYPESPGTGAERELIDQTLHLANVFQSTLDIAKLIELFRSEVGDIVPHDSLGYENAEDAMDVRLGTLREHRCSYEVVLMERSLGTLTLSRGTAFEAAELQRLEALLCALVYPLRNAILYKRAVETAFRDPVTGISNRAAMDAMLQREVDLAQRYISPLSLIMLDCDRFKDINDSFGHIAGDSVLRELVNCLSDCIRRSDIVFRYGGEEFTVVLSNTEKSGARLLAERIRRAVENHEFRCADHMLHLTVSVGVAELDAGDDMYRLLDKADRALYHAKESGRNRVIEYRG